MSVHALRKYGGTPTAVAVMAGVAIVAAAVAGGAAERADSQETFAKPAAPASVTAKLIRGKLEVSWKAPATASPAITHYVVSDHLRSSKKGTCPVTVSSTRRKAQLPILPGRTR
ncbi:MAG: hypothetical protein ACKOQ5_01010, partial [Solirubrobacterales bacterium]